MKFFVGEEREEEEKEEEDIERPRTHRTPAVFWVDENVENERLKAGHWHKARFRLKRGAGGNGETSGRETDGMMKSEG